MDMIFDDLLNIDVNYAINLHSFTDEEIADYIRDKITENNLKGLTKVRELLDKSVETKTLITLVSEEYRGFGKSYALAEKAEKLGVTLIVPPYLKQDYLQWLSEEQVKNYISAQHARGVKLPNGFLVDEGVSPDVIKELSRNSEFLGGFSRL